ncbi:3-oxoacyl-ACP reductase family protein [Clostridium sp. JS66]|uniref:SDR family NAD(P)-dependent oxidoreductase n=1 Tax=Clostridium sp. JS66 TaxID=3064705 RepID=UPI00298D8DDA|nr:3-oxoacyl-ACP reductase family protein [Clostridium sp. JS66]WPC41338.1 3-oxoacyl-ACP reductase family protein [Clostridium sp. JS66]
MDLKLKSKCAIVTGASRGVGKGIALALAKEGAYIVINYNKSEGSSKEVVNEIVKNGGKALAVKADLANPQDCIKLIDEAEREFGCVDILINNAGIWLKNWIQDITLDEWKKTIDVNLTSVFLTSQAFIKNNILQKRNGKILNITSQAAFHGATTGHAHYAASKAGVVALTVSMAREMAKYGINVNAVALGMVKTDMVSKALENNEDYYINRIPIGRVATPDDIGKIVAFMVSEAADYITGATIDATGGMLMR